MLFSTALTRKIKFRAVLVTNSIKKSCHVTTKGDIISYAPQIESPLCSHHPVPPSPHKSLSRMLWGLLLGMSISIDRLFVGNIRNTMDPRHSASTIYTPSPQLPNVLILPRLYKIHCRHLIS